ncbi:MAG: DEAD/DEAH box helicase [Chloroflexi bacterium]|nr:DEAD/DEAH box helicase [Chloroflexota bacterium]
MSFEDFALDPRILAGVEAAGFTTPTPIQEQAIPAVLREKDLLGLAQTGTGKTAAFLLPIFQRLMQDPSRKVRCLILAPTRELAEQIHQACRDLGRHTGVKSVAIYGGVSKGPQLTALRRGPEIVVACPGRLLDHLRERDIDLRNVEVLVLDEADTMCDMGFLPDVRRVLEQLPPRRQTLFFSATMPEQIRQLSQSILTDPVTIQINANAPAHTVSHALYPVPEKLKRSLLLDLLKQTATGKVVIFTRTKHRARTLARELEMRDFRVTQLHGNLSQNRRQRALSGFSDGKYDLLVATDIAAHGIDVTEVSHVINFDMPNTVDAYTHRIGRTGRALQTGEAFTLATPDDALMVRSVERTLKTRIERRSLAGFRYGDFSPEDQFSDHDQRPPRQRQAQPNGGRPNNVYIEKLAVLKSNASHRNRENEPSYGRVDLKRSIPCQDSCGLRKGYDSTLPHKEIAVLPSGVPRGVHSRNHVVELIEPRIYVLRRKRPIHAG